MVPIGGFLLEDAAGNHDELPVIDNWFETSGISAYADWRNIVQGRRT